jgi:hypothetical protein
VAGFRRERVLLAVRSLLWALKRYVKQKLLA